MPTAMLFLSEDAQPECSTHPNVRIKAGRVPWRSLLISSAPAKPKVAPLQRPSMLRQPGASAPRPQNKGAPEGICYIRSPEAYPHGAELPSPQNHRGSRQLALVCIVRAAQAAQFSFVAGFQIRGAAPRLAVRHQV